MSSQYLCRQNARTRLRVGCAYMKSRISKTRPGASTNSGRRLPPIPSIKISRCHCQHERQIADWSTSSLKVFLGKTCWLVRPDFRARVSSPLIWLSNSGISPVIMRSAFMGYVMLVLLKNSRSASVFRYPIVPYRKRLHP